MRNQLSFLDGLEENVTDAEIYAEWIDRPWRALTIQQPWASLIVEPNREAKRVENRTWSTKFRGPVLIHAGKGTSHLHHTEKFRHQGFTLPDPLPFGAVLGVAILRDCCDLDLLQPAWHAHRFAEGPVCWCLSGVIKLAEPIPMIGAQSLFAPQREAMQRVREQAARSLNMVLPARAG